MNAMSHNYKPAVAISLPAISESLELFFNGEDLLEKTKAIALSTVDADGWSRVSLLSAGEIIFGHDEGFRFCVFEQSGTAANLARDGRMTLSMAHDGGIWELRLRATVCDRQAAEASLAFFKAEIDSARLHSVPYAEVTSGVTFSLHEPSVVLQRWQNQIMALGALS